VDLTGFSVLTQPIYTPEKEVEREDGNALEKDSLCKCLAGFNNFLQFSFFTPPPPKEKTTTRS